MDINVCAIVVMYNGKKWIERCIGSLIKSTIKIHIIVIDNGSSDGSQEYIKVNYPEVEFEQSIENFKFGRGNNRGIKRALKHNPDYIFLLNQDAWVEQDCIESLVECHKVNDEFGIISPVHFSGQKGVLDNNFRRHLSQNSNLIDDLILRKKDNTIYQVPFVNAAMWLIPIQCIMQIGGFDHIFDHYGEDDDYVNRVYYHGFKVGICLSAFGYHDRNQFTDKYMEYNFDKDLQFRFRMRLIKLKALQNDANYLNVSRFRLWMNIIRKIIATIIAPNPSTPRRNEIVMIYRLNTKLMKYRNVIKISRDCCSKKGPTFLYPPVSG